MSFKDTCISYLQLWWPFCSAYPNHLSNFSREHYEEHVCEFFFWIWTRFRRCHLKYSYLQLWWPFCSAKQNHLCNFSRGHYWEHSCEIILSLEEMLFKENLWTDRWWTKTDQTIGDIGVIPVSLFENNGLVGRHFFYWFSLKLLLTFPSSALPLKDIVIGLDKQNFWA